MTNNYFVSDQALDDQQLQLDDDHGQLRSSGPISGFSQSAFPNNTYYGSTRPTGVKVFVRPNAYEAKRANIVDLQLGPPEHGRRQRQRHPVAGRRLRGAQCRGLLRRPRSDRHLLRRLDHAAHEQPLRRHPDRRRRARPHRARVQRLRPAPGSPGGVPTPTPTARRGDRDGRRRPRRDGPLDDGRPPPTPTRTPETRRRPRTATKTPTGAPPTATRTKTRTPTRDGHEDAHRGPAHRHPHQDRARRRGRPRRRPPRRPRPPPPAPRPARRRGRPRRRPPGPRPPPPAPRRRTPDADGHERRRTGPRAHRHSAPPPRDASRRPRARRRARRAGRRLRSRPTPTPTPMPGTDLMRIEAEAGAMTGPMVAASRGRGFRRQVHHSDTANSGTAKWNFTIPNAATTSCGAASTPSTANNDSFYVRADSGAEDVYDVTEGAGARTASGPASTGAAARASRGRSTPASFTFTAGSHTIRFRGRDPLTRGGSRHRDQRLRLRPDRRQHELVLGTSGRRTRSTTSSKPGAQRDHERLRQPLLLPGCSVTRAQMAVMILKAKYGSDYVPPPATGTVFTDVPRMRSPRPGSSSSPRRASPAAAAEGGTRIARTVR